MRIWRVSAIACLIVVGLSPAARAQTIGIPDVSGDQLLYVYDARTSRVPFLTVANPSDDTVFIDVAFYSQNLSTRLGGGVIELGPAANRVLDPTSDFGGVANGNAGLAVFTPVVSLEDATPVVPAEPLVGGFTLANTQLGSGFGENPFGRLAVTSSGARAAPGATVDGSAVSYERIAPSILVLPVYFNPQTLAPPENDGNRVVLVTFDDQYGTPFSVTGRTDTASARFFDASGFPVVDTDVTVDGVLVSNLQAIAGGPNVLTGSGKVFFDVTPGSGSYFGLFSQSLGTFSSGQRLPEAFTIPTGATGPTPTPMPSGGPGTPTPGPTGDPGGTTCNGQAVLTANLAFDSAGTSGVDAEILYPPSVSLPGCCNNDSVLARVENLTGIDGGIFGVADNDDPNLGPVNLSIGLVSLAETVPAGPFSRITFDCTPGATVSVQDFSCSAEVSDDAGNLFPGTCSLSLTLP